MNLLLEHGRTDIDKMTPAQARLHVAAIAREEALQRRLRVMDTRAAQYEPKDLTKYLKSLTPKD